MYRLLCSSFILVLTTSALFAQRKSPVAASPLSDRLIAQSQEWVNTWNDRDVDKLRSLHAKDISAQLYGIGEELYPVDKLLDDIKRENWWGLSWSITIKDPKVRMLGSDTALVAFRLVGTETNGAGASRVYSGAYSLLFERQKNEWKVVHVHSSHGQAPK
jgi:ketosteroid isomerase-like protein